MLCPQMNFVSLNVLYTTSSVVHLHIVGNNVDIDIHASKFLN